MQYATKAGSIIWYKYRTSNNDRSFVNYKGTNQKKKLTVDETADDAFKGPC